MNNPYEKFLIPLSIIIAGALIGGGYYVNSRLPRNTSAQVNSAISDSKNIKTVSSEDHILGNPKARVVIVEYSDTECPFCKQFHTTMRKVISDYGVTGNVAWVYRHFPIEGLHKKAPTEAEALECAFELGGNSKFWEYTNRLYEITPSNDGLAEIELTNIAKQVDLSSSDFNSCLSSGKYKDKVNASIEDAKKTGVDGTPYSIIIDNKTGDTYPLPGAQPYSNLKNIIDLILES